MTAKVSFGQTVISSMINSVKNKFSMLPVWLWLLQIMFTSFFSILFFALMVESIDSNITVEYVVIGNAVQSVAITTLYAVSDIPGTEKHVGTLPTLMSTPSSLFSIFLGMAIFNIVSGFLAVGISLCYATFIFGVSFSSANYLSVIVVIILTVLSLAGMGMAIGGIGLRLRTSAIIANVVSYIGLVLCGVNFPISYLPGWLQSISYCLPLTYAVDATRGAVAGSTVFALWEPISMMIILGLVYAVLSIVLFSFFEKSAKRSGSYDMF